MLRMTGSHALVLFGVAVTAILLQGPTVLAVRSVQDQYIYWSDPRVDIPRLFSLDHQQDTIVLAARNSICHLSLDLSLTTNLQDVTPSETDINNCKNTELRSDEECYNTYHVLQFPNMNTTLNVSGRAVPFSDTVLTCGTNAFNPHCQYRNRTSLEVLSSFSGVDFCPYIPHPRSTALLTSDGRLLAGTLLDKLTSQYGITRSEGPFMGSISQETIRGNNLWLQTPGSFVDMYERDDHYYIFMKEKAKESSTDPMNQVIYSRVARICKNDSGEINPQEPSLTPVFTTYLKARMACRSSSTSTIDYYYNDLEDTFYSNDSSSIGPVEEEHLYGVFRSPDNSPLGSALCVYTFGPSSNSLESVFSGPYLVESALNRFTRENNHDSSNLCKNGRTYSDAQTRVLMNDVATQHQPQSQTQSQPQPLLVIDGLLFHRIVVDQVPALDNRVYEVLFILASTNEQELQLLKVTHVPNRHGSTLQDKTHVSQTIHLRRDGIVEGANQKPGTMELHRNNNLVYISTHEGIYSVPVRNCQTYSGCNACLEAQDPYCAFDTLEMTCVPTSSSSSSSNLLQDVVNGNSSSCPVINTVTPTNTATLPPTSVICPSVTEAVPVRPMGTTQQLPTHHSSNNVPVPTREALTPTSNTDFIWPIVAGVGGLVVGIFFGIVLFALVRNRNNFIWSPRNRRGNYAVSYDENKDIHSGGAAEKNASWMNNSDLSKPVNRPSTPTLTKFNPTSHNKVTDSPVLSKYQGRGHCRSHSSGGNKPLAMLNNHNGDPNLKNTVVVEETVTNRDRERFGHNVASRQISRDYPPTPQGYAVAFHVRSGSLDMNDKNYP